MSLDLVIARKAEDHISSEDVQKIFETILGEERIVLEQPTIVSTLGQVVVTGGRYYLHGRYCYHREGTTDTLEVDPVSAAGKYRKDVLCIQYTVNNNIEDAEYVIVKGSEADSINAATYPQNKDDEGPLINGFRYVIAYLTISSTAVNYYYNTGVNKLIDYETEQESTFFGGNLLKQIGYITKGLRKGIIESPILGSLPNRFSAPLSETPSLKNTSGNTFTITGNNIFLDATLDTIPINKTFTLSHTSGGKVTYAIVERFLVDWLNKSISFLDYECWKYTGTNTSRFPLNYQQIICEELYGVTLYHLFSKKLSRIKDYTNNTSIVGFVNGFILDNGNSWKVFNREEIEYLDAPIVHMVPKNTGNSMVVRDMKYLYSYDIYGGVRFDMSSTTEDVYNVYVPDKSVLGGLRFSKENITFSDIS